MILGYFTNRKLTIISGGQTGVDRAALDFAIAHDCPHGGWCPRGRRAEDGVLDARYQLIETESRNYRQRTRRNVVDSDATLILNMGKLEGGSLATLNFAAHYEKPVEVVALDGEDLEGEAARVCAWLTTNAIGKLNLAGPRASKQPDVYRRAKEFLRVLELVNSQKGYYRS